MIKQLEVTHSGSARRLLGPGALIGTSAHDAAELQAGLDEGADYLGFGTLFPSSTKPELAAQGLEALRALAAECPVPIYGIGGVTAANAPAVIEAGAHGVAVGSAVLDADEPALQVTLFINGFLDEWTEGRIRHAREHGLLEMKPEEMEDLSEIILVIGRYWLDFSRKKYPGTDNVELRLKGLRHIFTVLGPYLLPRAKRLIAGRLTH